MKNKLVSKKLLKGVSLSMATVVAATTVGTVVYAEDEKNISEVTEEAAEAIENAGEAVDTAAKTINKVESTEVEKQLAEDLQEEGGISCRRENSLMQLVKLN